MLTIQEQFDKRFAAAKTNTELATALANKFFGNRYDYEAWRKIVISEDQFEKILDSMNDVCNENWRALGLAIVMGSKNLKISETQISRSMKVSEVGYIKELMINNLDLNIKQVMEMLEILRVENRHSLIEALILKSVNLLDSNAVEKIQRDGSEMECMLLWMSKKGDPPFKVSFVPGNSMQNTKRRDAVIDEIRWSFSSTGRSFKDWKSEYLAKLESKDLKALVNVENSLETAPKAL